MADLSAKRVAIVVDDYFEQPEFTGPRDALTEAGIVVDVISTGGGQIHGLNHVEVGETFDSDMTLDEAQPDTYDAVIFPGGAVNADALRVNKKAQAWVRQFLEEGKPVAAICHAPWLLASAGVLQGKTLTSWPTIQDDLTNAGATWVDEEVHVDGNLITSRQPDDVPAFSREIISALSAQ